MKTNVKLCLIAVLSVILVLGSCSKQISQPLQKQALIKVTNVSFSKEKGARDIPLNFSGNIELKVSTGAEWCTATLKGNILHIEVLPNEKGDKREAVVSISSGEASTELKVVQLGFAKDIMLDKTNYVVPASGGDVIVEVTTNTTFIFDFGQNASWLKEATTRAVGDMTPKSAKIIVDPNTTQDQRQCDVKIIAEGANGKKIELVFTIIQNGLGSYITPNNIDLPKDILIKPTSGVASSNQPNENIEKSFDDNFQTLYHSPWQNRPEYWPIKLTYNFDNVDMDYLVYNPRKDNGGNGNFKEVTIEVVYNEDGVNKTKTFECDFNGSGAASKVDFGGRLKGVRQIKFTVKSGQNNFASCSEMQFFKADNSSFDPSTLFADKILSTLKEDVTDEQIQQCPVELYKNLAYYMKQGQYPREFRIAEFKTTPYTETERAKAKISHTYSRFEPTGILIKKDEDLVLFAENIGNNRRLEIQVQDLDKQGGDGFGGPIYEVNDGLNKINMKEKGGLIYVLFHSDAPNWKDQEAARLHFVTGEVNGYYDSQKHKPEDYRRIIDKVTYKYFDVVGKYSHLTMETNTIRQNASSGKGLADTYDEIVEAEMRLMGLHKYNRVFTNKMYLNVMYHSYMYSTWYHTGYSLGTTPSVCNDVSTRKSNVWGQAHEIGHSNQTEGFKWIGMTEVTNNLFSEYVQTSLFHQDSRLQKEDMGGNNSRYAKAWNQIMLAGRAHNEKWGEKTKKNDQGQTVIERQGPDVFCQLVPFWQLELYFGNALGNTPLLQNDGVSGFYPDLFEYLRTHNIGNKTQETLEGQQSVNFAFVASYAAKADLTDFFEKWGFFKPINEMIGDYRNARFKVTQEMVDEVKAKIKELNYQKPTLAIEFITDHNWQLYKEPKEIVLGNYMIEGKKIRISNADNQVAFEVRDDKGKVVFYSQGMTATKDRFPYFNLPDNINWNQNYSLYAIDVWGNRHLMSKL